MVYVIIAIIFFLIETEYNYRVHLYNLKDIDKFEDQINFIDQKEEDLYFTKSYFRWRHSNSRKLFPKYKIIQIKRSLFIQYSLRVFGEEKFIDLIHKNREYLIKKYGKDIDIDIEVFDILSEYFSINNFKRDMQTIKTIKTIKRIKRN